MIKWMMSGLAEKGAEGKLAGTLTTHTQFLPSFGSSSWRKGFVFPRLPGPQRVAEDDLGILLCPPPDCQKDRRLSPCSVYAVLGFKPY